MSTDHELGDLAVGRLLLIAQRSLMDADAIATEAGQPEQARRIRNIAGAIVDEIQLRYREAQPGEAA